MECGRPTDHWFTNWGLCDFCMENRDMFEVLRKVCGSNEGIRRQLNGDFSDVQP
jgi:hypothetical protein